MGKFPVRSLLIAAAVLGLVIFVASQNNARSSGDTQSYSYFRDQIANNSVREILVKENEIVVTTRSDEEYITRIATPPTTNRVL